MSFKLKNQIDKSLDLTLILTVAALCIFGVIFVYDSSVAQAMADFGDSNYYIRQQLLWLLIGFLVLFFFSNFDYRNLKKISGLLLVGSLTLLVLVLVPGFGTSVGGARRWLNLGILSIQPSEIVKLASAIWLAARFEKGVRLKPFLLLLPFVVFVTAILQKDLGSAIVFMVMAGLIFLLSGGALWQIFLAVPVGIAGLLGLILTSDYRRNRILAFFDPFSDTQGVTYHISQVLIALGSGGITGLGLGQSRQKFYIPEITTDSIFAVIGEELGFLGGLFLIVLFSVLIFRGFKIAENCTDRFGQILAGGITSWLGIQAIINLGAMVSLFPLTGVPLPFISYGGSALVANLAAIGILLNISKKG